MSVPHSEFSPPADNLPSQHYFPLSNPDVLTARQRPASVDLPRSGVTAHYWVYGSNMPAIETLVLVHGFRGDHHGLLPIAEHLDNYRILAVDLPGFGQTGPLGTKRHDVDAYVDFLKEFLDTVRTDRKTDNYALVGHSFGSIVAGYFAARYPQDIAKLILINPIAAPALAGQQKILTGLALFYYRLSARLPEKIGLSLLRSAIITRLMTNLMIKAKDPSLKRFIKEQHQKYFSTFANRTVVLEAFEASISKTVLDVAPEITVPTLLIAGSRDEIVSLDSQRKLQGALPGAALEIIPGVGHLIHYEKTFRAAQMISSFLTQEPGGGMPPQ